MKQLYVILLLLCSAGNALPQDSLDLIDGIPLIITSWQAVDDYPDSLTLALKELGANAVIASDWQDRGRSLAESAGLLTIPYRVFPKENKADTLIVRYTDADYTVWEAEGNDLSEGEAKLTFDMDLGTMTDSFYTVSTPGNSVEVMWGPGYGQRINYQETNQNPIEHQVELICRARAKYGQFPSDTTTIGYFYVRQNMLGNQNQYRNLVTRQVTVGEVKGDSWKSIYDDYFLTGSVYESLTVPEESEGFYSAGFIQFIFHWSGNDSILFDIDKVKTYDLRYGKDIAENNYVRSQVLEQAASILSGGGNPIGIYGMEEPKFIDNFAPYRMVDGLVRDVQSGVYLHTSFTPGQFGRFGPWSLWGGAWSIFKANEFYRRAKPHLLHLNLYHYDYPFSPANNDRPAVVAAKRQNLTWVITNLKELRKVTDRFGYAIYGGMCYRREGNGYVTHLRMPTTKEMLYSANLGLLYGAKQIWIDPYFSYNYPGTSIGVRGLIDIDYRKTERYFFVRDTLNPRLKGLFGKSLKRLFAAKQDSVRGVQTTTGEGYQVTYRGGDYDVGIFTDLTDSRLKCIMLLNREYNADSDSLFHCTIAVDTAYKNYSVINAVDTVEQVLQPCGDGSLHFSVFIPQSGAGLYLIRPMAKKPGDKTFLYDETLTEHLTVNTGERLVIRGGAELTFTGNASINSGGSVVVRDGSRLLFDPQGTQNGILSYSPGTVELTGATISGASYGVYANSSTVTITGSLVTGCDYGVYLYNCNAGDRRIPLIDGSTLTGNTYGIYAYNSEAMVSNTLLESNTIGAATFQNSVLTFSDSGAYGNNCFIGNGIGITANYSYPILGIEGETGGGNDFRAQSEFCATAVNYSIIEAEENYWGKDNNDLFDLGMNCEIDAVPELTEGHCVMGNRTLIGEPELKGEDILIPQCGTVADTLRNIRKLILRGGGDPLVPQIIRILHTYPDSAFSIYGVQLLLESERISQTGGLTRYINEISTVTALKPLYCMAKITASLRIPGQTLTGLNQLIDEYAGNENLVYPLFAKFMYLYHQNGDRTLLEYTGELITAGFPGSKEAIEVIRHLSELRNGVEKIKHGSGQANGVPERYLLHEPFPNPFNPEVTFRFTIPEASEAELVVYDITGSEIMRKVFDGLPSGTHSWVWNASESPRASGVYLYLFHAKAPGITGNKYQKTGKIIYLK